MSINSSLRRKHRDYDWTRPTRKDGQSKDTTKRTMRRTPSVQVRKATLGKRNYEVQRDGSWIVLNKPRSRVKRLRMERATSAAAPVSNR